MELYLKIMDLCMKLQYMKFTIYGFTFSYWDVFMTEIAFFVVCLFVHYIYHDD